MTQRSTKRCWNCRAKVARRAKRWKLCPSCRRMGKIGIFIGGVLVGSAVALFNLLNVLR